MCTKNSRQSTKATYLAKTTGLIALAGVIVMLNACGGGGNGEPAPGEGPGNGTGGGGAGNDQQRMSEIILDFDNNGQMDARITYSYFADGRLSAETYEYVGDGTPDIYNPYYNGSNTDRVDVTYSYDGVGNLTGVTFYQNNGTNVGDYAYTFNGTDLVQVDITDTTPVVTTFLLGQLIYQNGLPSQYDISLNGITQVSFNYQYNGNNQITQEVRTFTGSNNPQTRTFTWNADGSIDTITIVDNFTTNMEAFTYNNGLLVRRDFTFSNPPTNSNNTNVSWLYYYANGVPTGGEYDLNMDGTIDGTLTVTMENGPCTPVYFNIVDEITQAGIDGLPGSPNGIVWCG